MTLDPIRIGDWDDEDGKPFTAYIGQFRAYPGLQVARTKAVGRIKNLTSQAGKGLTDDLVAKLLAKFPAGRPPTHLFGNPTVIEQLRASRTATNATGTPAPTPTEVHNIPLLPTESLINGEAN